MTDLRRKKELAKIHVAKKALGLDDDTYRTVLIRVTGRESAGDLNQFQRTKLLEEMKALGFKDEKRPPRRAGTRPADASPEAAKIRALWLALYQLGAVEDSREAAIAAYVKRMTGKDAMQFLSQRDVAKVINTLRAWCDRVGFREPDAASLSFFDSLRAQCGLDRGGHGLAAKCALIKALFDRATAGHWQKMQPTLEAWLLGNYRVQDLWALSPEDADGAIEQLGRIVRRRKKAEQA